MGRFRGLIRPATSLISPANQNAGAWVHEPFELHYQFLLNGLIGPPALTVPTAGRAKMKFVGVSRT